MNTPTVPFTRFWKTRNLLFLLTPFFLFVFPVWTSFLFATNNSLSNDSLDCQIPSVIFECQGIEANKAAARAWHEANKEKLRATCPARDSGKLVISSLAGIDILNDVACIPCTVYGYYDIIDTVGGFNTIETRRATFKVVDTKPPVFLESTHDTIQCSPNFDAIFGWREYIKNIARVSECNYFRLIRFTNFEIVEKRDKSIIYRYGISIDDSRGNVGYESILLTVIDTIPPIVSCNPENLELAYKTQTQHQATAAEWNANNILQLQNCSREPCSEVTVTSDFDSNNLSNGYETVVTYTIADELDNQVMKTAIFSIKSESKRCENIDIRTSNNEMEIRRIKAPNSIIKIFDANWQPIYNCSGDCPQGTLSLGNLNEGATYHTDIQFYDANWNLICESKQAVQTKDSLSRLVCKNVQISTQNNQITFSNLTTPNQVIKVFDQAYRIVYEC